MCATKLMLWILQVGFVERHASAEGTSSKKTLSNKAVKLSGLHGNNESEAAAETASGQCRWVALNSDSLNLNWRQWKLALIALRKCCWWFIAGKVYIVLWAENKSCRLDRFSMTCLWTRLWFRRLSSFLIILFWRPCSSRIYEAVTFVNNKLDHQTQILTFVVKIDGSNLRCLSLTNIDIRNETNLDEPFGLWTL